MAGLSALEARRRILMNTPHIETAAGNMATFSADMVGKLKSCRVSFSPVQEGSGDPAPDNVRPITGWTGCTVWRTGKNLLDPEICFHGSNPSRYVNADGSVTQTGRDGTSWFTSRGYMYLPTGDYLFHSRFGSAYHSRYIKNDINVEINFFDTARVSVSETTKFRFKAAMGTVYPVTGWIQIFRSGVP